LVQLIYANKNVKKKRGHRKHKRLGIAKTILRKKSITGGVTILTSDYTTVL
jgi:hypothetical protein